VYLLLAVNAVLQRVQQKRGDGDDMEEAIPLTGVSRWRAHDKLTRMLLCLPPTNIECLRPTANTSRIHNQLTNQLTNQPTNHVLRLILVR
jgi:hypothetical protein